jgi:uncharacterized membrane protein YcaP (DUF421 family)
MRFNIMMEVVNFVFGEGKDLSILNMCCRAILVYFAILLLIKLSGMRTFGQQSAFDTIIVITMGALLSRLIVGASVFIPTLCAGILLALLHRLTAYLTIQFDSMRKLFKGEELSLYKDGKLNLKNMNKCMISEGDLIANVRLQANLDSLVDVKEARMERTGEISIIKK